MSLLNFFFKSRRKKVGLALSGGSARGLAHIGVLKVLKRHKIPIHSVAGVSAGALVGIIYAAGMDPDIMEVNALKLHWFRFLKIILGKHGPLGIDEIERFIIQNVGDKDFSELNLPFAALATDLKTGKEVVLKEGKVAHAVAISCAFPGFFQPVNYKSDLLVDGGLINNLPSAVAKKLGADFIIAVDVVPGYQLRESPKNIFQVLGRSYDIVMKKISEEGRNLADVVIEPEIPQDIWHLDIDEAPRLIKAGEEAAEKKILEIKAKLMLS